MAKKFPVSLISIFIMRVCISITSNAIRALKVGDYVRDAQTENCYFEGRSSGNLDLFQVPIYVIQFFLPALGGLIADKWLGEIYLIRISGILLLICAVYVAAIEMAGYICIPWMYLLGLLPSSFANGIGAASLLAAPLKISEGHYGSPTPGLIVYYVSGALGQVIGDLSRPIRPYANLTWIFCAFPPLVYIVASFACLLDFSSYRDRFRDQLTDSFHFPTRARFIRYFLLLAPIVLLISVVAFPIVASYCFEINYYLNTSSTNTTDNNCPEVFTANLLTASVTLGLLGICYRIGYLGLKNGQISGRFYSGLTALLISRSALIAWNSWAASLGEALPDPWLVHTVYSAASIMDGIGNALALATGYELMYRVAQVGNKNLVMGFLLTVYATGALITGMTIIIMQKLPPDQPILIPVYGKSNIIWLLYLVLAIEVTLIIIYYRFVSIKIARTMMVLNEDSDEGLVSYRMTSITGTDEFDEFHGVDGSIVTNRRGSELSQEFVGRNRSADSETTHLLNSAA